MRNVSSTVPLLQVLMAQKQLKIEGDFNYSTSSTSSYGSKTVVGKTEGGGRRCAAAAAFMFLYKYNQPITACKRHSPAAGATQDYDRLHAKR
jgi:hypothetical protein